MEVHYEAGSGWQLHSSRKDVDKMNMRENIKIYRDAINKALVAVGKEYGLELKCGSAEFSDYDFTIKLKGVVKSDTVNGEQELFKEQAPFFGFHAEDYGKEFMDKGKRYRFIGFNIRARKNPCVILCLKDNKKYACSADYLRSFIKKSSPDKSTLAGKKAAGQEADTLSWKTVTYYVAECMEIPNLGEYHEGLTVEQAVEIYNRIPAERRNAIKGIGIVVHTEGQPDYTDAHYEVMHLSALDPGMVEYAGEDKPLVLAAYQALLECLEEKGVRYTIASGGK